jgi:hypothetical protein
MILYMFTKVQIITSNLKFQKTDWKEQVRKCMNNVTIRVQTFNYSLQYVPTTPCAKKRKYETLTWQRWPTRAFLNWANIVKLCESYRRNELDIKHTLPFSLTFVKKTVTEMCSRCAHTCMKVFEKTGHEHCPTTKRELKYPRFLFL